MIKDKFFIKMHYFWLILDRLFMAELIIILILLSPSAKRCSCSPEPKATPYSYGNCFDFEANPA